MSGILSVKKFEQQTDSQKWDNFVLNSSYNGTILQTRSFLNYHSAGKFQDDSLLFIKGESTLIAVIPACTVMDGGKKVFSSHAGSTFGGIVLDKNYLNISSVKEVLEALEEYLRENKYDKVILKQTGDVFSQRNNDLLYYYLFNKEYLGYDELSFCLDYRTLSGDIVGNMKSKTRNEYRFALKSGLSFERLNSDKEVKAFYDILCKSLQKYDTKPVHTFEELLLLRDVNLKDRVEFYGVFKERQMIAGSMVFLFDRVFHTQYLAADPDYLQYKPMNFLDGQLMEEGFKRKFDFFSFGISTENHGKYLNESLAKFKEGFGTGYYINRTFYKDL